MWLKEVIVNFFAATNFIDNFVKVVGLGIVVWGVIVAANAFKGYEKKRDDAIWSFYVNLVTFLDRLELTIGKKNNRTSVTDYFFKQSDNASEMDKMDICNFQMLALNFLNYLSTSSGQIPPSIEFENWKKQRLELIKFLHKALSLGLKKGIEEDNLESELSNIHQVIKSIKDTIDEEIAKYESKVKNDIPQTEID